MMKRYTSYILAIIAVLLCFAALFPEDLKSQVNKNSRLIYKMPKEGNFLRYKVEDGDTVYIGTIAPSYSIAKGKYKRDWKKYTRLVYNFSKVYPYSLEARRLIHEADSTFDAGNYGRRKKEKYVNELQKKLMKTYEKTARSMTVSQGQLLMRLIDREAGLSTYEIIRNYKSGIAAGFWQGVAKLFGTDTKQHYDPEGEDRDTEDLVRKWESGEFRSYYFSIFGEYAVIPEIPENF